MLILKTITYRLMITNISFKNYYMIKDANFKNFLILRIIKLYDKRC